MQHLNIIVDIVSLCCIEKTRLYSTIYAVALYHGLFLALQCGFLTWLYSGLYAGLHVADVQAAPCELNPMVGSSPRGDDFGPCREPWPTFKYVH